MFNWKNSKTLYVFTQHFITFHFRKEMILDKAGKESKSLWYSNHKTSMVISA